MIELRPYQREAIENLREGFKYHQRQILALATGSGKTVIFTEMVCRASEKGTRVLILTHRRRLFQQTLSAIAKHNVAIQLVEPNTKIFHPSAPVTVSMVETLRRRMKKWVSAGIRYNPDLIFIDEAHFGNFNYVIESFPQAKVVAVSATPIGKHFYKHYTNIVQNISISDLIQQGYLCPAKSFMMRDDLSGVKISHGEYEEKSLFNHFDKPALYRGLIDQYKSKVPGTKALVFSVNIKHCEKTNKEFNDAGIKAEMITNKTPDQERDRILSDFTKGKFPVLNSVGILTVGFDEPSIQSVLINRATKSEALFMQMCGRGGRIYPGKTHFTILDFGNNFLEHGLWESDRKWELKPPSVKRKKPAPVRNCPKCTAILHASVRVCKHCGYEFPREGRIEKDGVLVEVTEALQNKFNGRYMSELNIEELIDLGKSRKIKAEQIWKVVRSHGIDAVRRYGAGMEYKEGWVMNQLMEMNDCEYRDRLL